MLRFFKFSVYGANKHKKIGKLFIVQIYTGYFFKPLTYATNACVNSLRITKKVDSLRWKSAFLNFLSVVNPHFPDATPSRKNKYSCFSKCVTNPYQNHH